MTIWDELKAWLAGRRTERLKEIDSLRRHALEQTDQYERLRHELIETIMSLDGTNRRKQQVMPHPARRDSDRRQGRKGRSMPSARYRPRDEA